MNRPVLLTGGRGFVGRFLAAELGNQAALADADVTQAEDVAAAIRSVRPAALVHLAAATSVASSWHDAANVWTVNVIGTVNVLDAVRNESPDTRLVVVSSGEVYGETLEAPAHEDAPVRPVSPYGASKVAAEVAAERAARVDGLDVIVARPFQHVGPGQDARFAVGSWTRQIAELERRGGGALEVGDLSVERDLLDVRDVVRAYRLVIEPSVPPGVYNISTGRAVTLDDVVRTLVGFARCPVEIVERPEFRRAVDVRRLAGDPSHLVEATGWRPMFTLERTLADALEAARRSAEENTVLSP